MANRMILILLFLSGFLLTLNAQEIKVFNQDTTKIKGKSIQLEASRTIIDSVFNIRPDSVRFAITSSDTVITFNSSSVRLWESIGGSFTLKRISSPTYRQLKDGDRIRIICIISVDGITVQNSSGGSGNIVLTGGAAVMNQYSVMEFEYISYLGKWLEVYRRL